MDYKEYARVMRTAAVRDENGNIICSPELWERIATIIENIDTTPKLIEILKGGADNGWIKTLPFLWEFCLGKFCI